MTTFRLLLFAFAAALTLLVRSALAQNASAPPPAAAKTPASASTYQYTFLWGLWSNQDKSERGSRARFKADYMRPVAARQPTQWNLAKTDSTYQYRSILGGAVQWIEKRPNSTR